MYFLSHFGSVFEIQGGTKERWKVLLVRMRCIGSFWVFAGWRTPLGGHEVN